tara:strand:+ start:6027 stop:8192 length:2166 start_codon:yes stop_codon:yes gene_type:complete
MKRLILLFIVLPFLGVSQSNNLDSLFNQLHKVDQQQKSGILNEIAFNFRVENPDSCISLVKQSISIAQKYNQYKELGYAYNLYGIASENKGDIDSSLAYYNRALVFFKRTENLDDDAMVYVNLGAVHRNRGRYEEALNYYFKGVKIVQKSKNWSSLTSFLNNIALVYWDMSNLEKTKEYLLEQKTIAEEHNIVEAQSRSYLNLAILYDDLGEDSLIQKYDQLSLQLNRKLNDRQGISINLVNIGVFYDNRGDLATALKYYNEARAIKEEIQDEKGLVNLLINIGMLYDGQGKKELAEKTLLEANQRALSIKNVRYIKNSYEALAEFYEEKDYKKAYKYYQMYSQTKDSILNLNSSSKLAELGAKYDDEKKKNQITLLKKEQELQNVELKEATLRAYFLYGGLGTLLLLCIIIFIGFKSKQKANQLISAQKKEVEFQKEVVEQKHKEITDSINYAKRIQSALLKSEEHQSEHLPEHFIFFKPKDVVSGDFYWALEKQDYLYLAAADCTGHGVPGAFLTMLGTSFLNEINAGENLLSPASILDLLRARIIEQLNQNGEEGESRDGMDISLLRLNLKTHQMEWAGANNPIWIIPSVTSNADEGIASRSIEPLTESFTRIDSQNELIEIKGDKQPISYYTDMKPYTNHSFQLQKGVSIYIFSDGYADQFGGPKGKKYKYKELKNSLLSIANLPLKKQKNFLSEEFEKWKGDLEQIDDVCIIGVRI